MKAGAAGGIEAVVKAINTHINNADVCRTGCGALWDMANNSKTLISQQALSKMKQTAENKVKAGETGGIEAVVKAISIHIDNADVCQQGCSTLWCMTVNNGKRTNKTKKMK